MKKQLNLIELSKVEEKNVKGGSSWYFLCYCACAYEGTPDGSSTEANFSANTAEDLVSPTD